MIQQETAKANILVVDDIPANLHLFAKMLGQQGYKVRSAVTGTLAISGAKAMPPDLILLDILMPELDGYQVCSLLKADPRTEQIPIVFISALGEEIDKVRAFEVGGVDYITKPFLKAEVLARIDYHIRAHHTQQKLLEKNSRLQEEIEYRCFMEAKLERFSFHLKHMHRLNTSHYSTIADLLRDYLQTGCSILGCSTGWIARIEDGVYTIDAMESAIEEIDPSWKLELHDTPFDRAIQTRSTATHQWQPVGDGEATYVRGSQPVGLGTHRLESSIGTPIWIDNHLYGAIGFGSLLPREEDFNTQEREILELMAQSLGKWIGIRQTARKRQQAEEQTQLLLKVTQAISRSPDFETALRSALQHLCESSGWSYGEAWLPNADGSLLQLSPAWYAHQQESPEVLECLQNFRQGRLTQRRDLGILNRVWARGEAEYAPNVLDRSHEIGQDGQLFGCCHIEQGLWIPIRSVSSGEDQDKGKVLAILVLFLSDISTLPVTHQSDREATHRLMDLASAIASQLGTVIRQKQIEAEQTALLGAMDDRIAIYDARGTCLRCISSHPNCSMESAESSVNLTLDCLFPPAEAESHYLAIAKTLETKETQTIAYHLTIGDRRMWFSGKISPLTEQTVLSVIRDITPLEAATAALQQSEAKFRAIFEWAGIGIYITSLNGDLLDSNAAFQSFLGYSAADLHQMHYADLLHQDDSIEGDNRFQTLLLGQIDSYQVEKRYYHRSGAIMWGRLTVSAVRDGDAIAFVLGMVEDITERHHIELALKESETRYRELIEVQQDVLVCRWKPNTQLTFVNQYFCQFFNLSAAEPIDLLLNDFLVNPEDENNIQQKILALLEDLNPESWEYKYRSGTGEPRWLRWTNQPILDRWGSLVDIQSFGVDITAQKQRELAFKLIAQGTASASGNEFFNSCARYLADVLQVDYTLIAAPVEPHHRRVRILSFWDGKQLQAMGEFETIGSPWDRVLLGEEVYYPDNLQVHFPEHSWLQQLQAESYLGIPLRNRRDEIIGYLSILDRGKFEKDAAKQAILNIFVARTESELERTIAEEKLKKIAYQERSIAQILERMRETLDLDRLLAGTTAEIRQVFQSDRVAIYQCNPDWSGQFVAESKMPGLNALVDGNGSLSFTSEAITDESCAVKSWIDTPRQRSSSLLSAQGGTEWVSRSSQYLAMSDIYQVGFEVNYLKFLETIQARSYLILPIFCTQQLWGLLGIYQSQDCRDWLDDEIQMAIYIVSQLGITIQQSQLVSQIKQQSYELQIAKDSADAANRAKSSFLAKMSHQLRTPLNAILGFTQVMGRDRSLSVTQHEQLTIINHSGKKLLELINNVLEMSKIEAGQMSLQCTDFNLRELLDKLKKLLQLKASIKGIELEFKLGDRVPEYVYGDEGKLQQVLLNLLDNGIKFTDRGRVSLEVSLVSSLVRPPSEKLNLHFAVSDTGIGIPQEELEILFEPFRMHSAIDLQQEQEGTGLGLPIGHHFVQLMGGTLTVASILGGGSHFRFEIPLAAGQPKLAAADLPREKIVGLIPEQPNYRILVVDDERDHRLLMMHLLATVGFAVREACNGKEAIAIWEAWQPHLITMDMRMPVMNGLEATQQIKATLKGQTTTIVALTAHAFQQDRQQVLMAGCDDFLSKPFEEQMLLEKISHHLGVRYLYDTSDAEVEQKKEQDSHGTVSATDDIADTQWQEVSADCLMTLHQRAIEADAESILSLSEQIAHPAIAQWLQQRVRYFEFEEIAMEIEKFLARD
ncbi:response regulator [Roseofilum casamattae]|uniref:histidine kinase n=1 Tax=Roseofilum casamattae BLCC-M143 TaxID=3022442 RepID=A0ABT7BZV3_9CYAN|nr:response regulator [Roseofilum casamattae]MDJ1184736.1 response regulator [Roseofilum casamattae BLCC-M143]